MKGIYYSCVSCNRKSIWKILSVEFFALKEKKRNKCLEAIDWTKQKFPQSRRKNREKLLPTNCFWMKTSTWLQSTKNIDQNTRNRLRVSLRVDGKALRRLSESSGWKKKFIKDSAAGDEVGLGGGSARRILPNKISKMSLSLFERCSQVVSEVNSFNLLNVSLKQIWI